MMPDMQLVATFAEQFAACAVAPGEVAVVLCERASRRELVDTAIAALTQLGAHPAVVEVPTPAASSPVPVRSTGASHAVAGHRSAIAACASADFVVDCTVEGLLHAPELGTILADGARVLMISNEHPEVFARSHPTRVSPTVFGPISPASGRRPRCASRHPPAPT